MERRTGLWKRCKHGEVAESSICMRERECVTSIQPPGLTKIYLHPSTFALTRRYTSDGNVNVSEQKDVCTDFWLMTLLLWIRALLGSSRCGMLRCRGVEGAFGREPKIPSRTRNIPIFFCQLQTDAARSADQH